MWKRTKMLTNSYMLMWRIDDPLVDFVRNDDDVMLTTQFCYHFQFFKCHHLRHVTSDHTDVRRTRLKRSGYQTIFTPTLDCNCSYNYSTRPPNFNKICLKTHGHEEKMILLPARRQKPISNISFHAVDVVIL